MANFIDTNINQTVFLDINYLDQLGTDNFNFYLYSLLTKPHFLDDFLNGYKIMPLTARPARPNYYYALFFALIIAESLQAG